jgi:hypothetical protein
VAELSVKEWAVAPFTIQKYIQNIYFMGKKWAKTNDLQWSDPPSKSKICLSNSAINHDGCMFKFSFCICCLDGDMIHVEKV